MEQLKIQDIEAHFDDILQLTGEQSYVDWDTFTKSSTQFTKTLEELAKNIAILREIQQKKFIQTMKKLKSSDVPDLIKTVKSKKLPSQALRSISTRFKMVDGKIELAASKEELQKESKQIFDEYISNNEQSSSKAKETVEFLNEKIKKSGLYEEPELKELVSTFTHKFDDERLTEAKKKVEIKYLPNTVDTIHISTYAQIIEQTYEVVKDQYRRLTSEARVKQRGLTQDMPKYLETLTEYLTNTQVLILEGQKAISNKVGISNQRLEESEGTLMERGLGQNILILQSGLRTKVKESIVAEKPIPLEKAKDILKFQIGLLSSRTDYFKGLFGNMEKNQDNLQLVPMILALALNDMVFEKHNLEEEDIMKNVTDQMILTNPEFSELFKDLEIKIIKLMETIGAIPEQISQYMQNQSTMPMGQMNPNAPNPMAGMLPGSNPMDLLQLQQYMQMQQMQQQQPKN